MYRFLEAYDSIVSLCMPASVKTEMDKTRSFNTSGIPFTGEGGDFKLEAINKGVQHWGTGNPTELDWEKACMRLTTHGLIRGVCEKRQYTLIQSLMHR